MEKKITARQDKTHHKDLTIKGSVNKECITNSHSYTTSNMAQAPNAILVHFGPAIRDCLGLGNLYTTEIYSLLESG